MMPDLDCRAWTAFVELGMKMGFLGDDIPRYTYTHIMFNKIARRFRCLGTLTFICLLFTCYK